MRESAFRVKDISVTVGREADTARSKGKAMTEDDKKVGVETSEVAFIGAESAPQFFINGVWGGASFPDVVVAHFVFECRATPEKIDIDDNTGEIVDTPKVAYVREVLATLILPAICAKSIGKWLITHADSIIEGETDCVPPGETVQ